jgi:hypothetical protein
MDDAIAETLEQRHRAASILPDQPEALYAGGGARVAITYAHDETAARETVDQLAAQPVSSQLSPGQCL